MSHYRGFCGESHPQIHANKSIRHNVLLHHLGCAGEPAARMGTMSWCTSSLAGGPRREGFLPNALRVARRILTGNGEIRHLHPHALLEGQSTLNLACFSCLEALDDISKVLQLTRGALRVLARCFDLFEYATTSEIHGPASQLESETNTSCLAVDLAMKRSWRFMLRTWLTA